MPIIVPKYKWSTAVKNQDNNRCVYCGSTNRLETHHILPKSLFPEKENDVENGVTLCHKCHYTIHHANYSNDRKHNAIFKKFSCEPELLKKYISDYVEQRKK